MAYKPAPPAQYSKSYRGGDARFNVPPSGAPDQVMPKGGIPSMYLSEKGALEQKNAGDQIVNRPAPTYATTQPSVIDAANALDASRMGFTVDFNNPAVNAIDTVAAPSVAGMYGSAFRGGWGAQGFMAPGAMEEANGLPIDSSVPLSSPLAGSPVAPAAPAVSSLAPTSLIAQLFAPSPARPARPATPAPVAPAVGYNGRSTVTSNELAGGNGSIFGENAVLPSSMNTERWITGY